MSQRGRGGLLADDWAMKFPTTHWSLLTQAGADGDTDRRKALEALCGLYWRPVHQFVRFRGIPSPEAEDLTQDFMVHLLHNSLFSRADPLRGRFRSFLLGVLVRFMADRADKLRALKRGGGAQHVSLDSGLAEDTVRTASYPDAVRVFDREWAVAVLDSALEAARREYASERRAAEFAVLERFLPGPEPPPSYEVAARELGVTVAALKTQVHRLRGRLRALMRAEVGRTVSAPHEIEAEMAHLFNVLVDGG